MRGPNPISVIWQEDGSATCLARVCARDGSGSFTGKKGEGRFVKQSDIASIVRKVFDRDSETPDEPLSTTNITVSTAILDTPDTSGEIWTEDDVGYNFLNDLPPDTFPEGDRKYRVEYRFTTNSGAAWTLGYEGKTTPVVGS